MTRLRGRLRLRLGSSDLDVFPLCLGGNVFGWTADREETFAVLDGFVAAGGNLIDTADVYSAWADGNSGGESETLIGEWIAERGNRDDVLVATKVGGDGGLGAGNIRRRCDESLARLKTDRIDLYYAHFDDEDTPLAETLGAFDELVRAGKVRHIAASNYSAARLREALDTSESEGFVRYVALQPKYNLMDRDDFEGELQELCVAEDVAVLPYSSLASGFLSGKFRPGGAREGEVDSKRNARGVSPYSDDPRADRVLALLDELAAAHEAPVAAVALAWLAAQPAVVAPIASARTPQQLPDLLAMAELELDPDEPSRLTEATDG